MPEVSRMAGPKIDKLKLHRLLRHGKLQKEIAQLFGATKGAISKAKKGLTMNGREVDKDSCLGGSLGGRQFKPSKTFSILNPSGAPQF
jgi:hypothetical protein